MAAESRQKNRRSISLFSLEHFRSLSRSGHHPEQDQPSGQPRATSSLSCDPHNQLATVPKTTVTNPGVAGEKVIKSSTTQLLKKTAFPRIQDRIVSEDGQIKSRPRSWFSLSRTSLGKRPNRSLSIQLQRGNSSSTMSKSVISAPVLIGTTNMEVAEAEGVCCRDLVDAGLNTQTQEAKPPKAEVVAPGLSLENVKSIKPRLFRVATAGRAEDSKASILNKLPPCNSENQSEETWRFSNVERGVARRRAETINLCRQKINRITGNGHVKRKSVHTDEGNTLSEHHRTGNGDIIEGSPRSDVIKQPGKCLTLLNSNSDLAFGSLTRSFASAIDKLDFHSSPTKNNMPLMKSKSSIFSTKKRGKNVVDPGLVDYSKTVDGVQSGSEDQPTQGDGESAKLPENARKATGFSKLSGSPPEPIQFFGPANAYVSSEAAADYPGGIKALGMHSKATDFATAPNWVTDLPKPHKHTPTLKEVTSGEEEDDNEHAIQDAPIYSPSLGNLSQYARPSPPPAQPVTRTEQRSEPETPTRVPAEKHHRRRLGVRKSRSGLALLSMFNKGPKERKEVGALQARDGNQKMAAHQQLKKSRSMNLAALLRRGDSNADKGPLSRESSGLLSQPMKPSPLRYESRVDEDGPVEQASTPHTRYKRTPPRGQLTPTDRAKRMGMVGVPGKGEGPQQ